MSFRPAVRSVLTLLALVVAAPPGTAHAQLLDRLRGAAEELLGAGSSEQESGEIGGRRIQVETLAPLDLSAFPPGQEMRYFTQAYQRMGGRQDGAIQNQLGPTFALTESGHAASVIKAGSRVAVVHDGVEGPPFTAITQLALSPDGQRVAYVVQEGTRYRVAVNHELGPAYDDVQQLTFSPDGSRLIYLANEGGRGIPGRLAQGGTWRLVDEGTPREPATSVQILGFSSAGVLAWVENRADGSAVHVDGYDPFIGGSGQLFAFSPDGTRFAFTASGGTRVEPESWVVLDGQRLPGYAANCLRFSRDGAHLIYNAMTDAQALMRRETLRPWIDGEQTAPLGGGQCGQGLWEAIDWSPLGRVARVEPVDPSSPSGPFRVVTDGTPSLEYRSITGVRFVGETPLFLALQGRDQYLVYGDVEIPLGMGAASGRTVSFDENGEHFAVLVRDAQTATHGLWVDGEHVADRVHHFAFAPDGSNYAYVTSDQLRGPQTVVHNGQRHGPFEGVQVGELVVSRDGAEYGALGGCTAIRGGAAYTFSGRQCQRLMIEPSGQGVVHQAIVAVQENGRAVNKTALVFDGQATPPFDYTFLDEATEVLPNMVNSLRFTADGGITFLVLDEGAIKRVTVAGG